MSSKHADPSKKRSARKWVFLLVPAVCVALFAVALWMLLPVSYRQYTEFDAPADSGGVSLSGWDVTVSRVSFEDETLRVHWSARNGTGLRSPNYRLLRIGVTADGRPVFARDLTDGVRDTVAPGETVELESSFPMTGEARPVTVTVGDGTDNATLGEWTPGRTGLRKFLPFWPPKLFS